MQPEYINNLVSRLKKERDSLYKEEKIFREQAKNFREQAELLDDVIAKIGLGLETHFKEHAKELGAILSSNLNLE